MGMYIFFEQDLIYHTGPRKLHYFKAECFIIEFSGLPSIENSQPSIGSAKGSLDSNAQISYNPFKPKEKCCLYRLSRQKFYRITIWVGPPTYEKQTGAPSFLLIIDKAMYLEPIPTGASSSFPSQKGAGPSPTSFQ